MVAPVSSAEAECSFSALRRLKTWLRSTMTQKGLNGIAVCHVHQDLLGKNWTGKTLPSNMFRGMERGEIFLGPIEYASRG